MTAGSIARAAAAVRASWLIVEAEQCINPRGRDLLCRRCEKVCTADAIGLSADDVDLADDLCTRCGACVPACPTGVFRLSVFDPERFLGSLAGRDVVHLHCGESRDPGGGIVIPCHQMVDPGLAAAAVAEGVTRLVFHGSEGCEDCALGDARPQIDRVQRNLGRWFGERAPAVERAPATASPSVGPALRHDQPATDRRGFLRGVGVRAVAGAAWLVPMADDEPDADGRGAFRGGPRDMPKRPSPWRMSLARRLPRLRWAPDRPLPWHVRSVADSCTGCMVCAERCPTGALEADVAPSARSLTFEPELCTNCTLCQRICPADAVRPRRAERVAEVWSQRHVLVHMAQQPCPQCGVPVVGRPGSGPLCTTCANEQDCDDEWMAMLGK